MLKQLIVGAVTSAVALLPTASDCGADPAAPSRWHVISKSHQQGTKKWYIRVEDQRGNTKTIKVDQITYNDCQRGERWSGWGFCS